MKKVITLVELLCLASVAMAQYTYSNNHAPSLGTSKTKLIETCLGQQKDLTDRIKCIMKHSSFDYPGQLLASLHQIMNDILDESKHDRIRTQEIAEDFSTTPFFDENEYIVYVLEYVEEFAPQLTKDESMQQEYISQMYQLTGKDQVSQDFGAISKELLDLADSVEQLIEQ